jgi:uncharacterized protein YuzE
MQTGTHMTANVAVTYDAAGDSAYIYLRPPRPCDRVRTTLICEQEPGNPAMVFVDVDLASGHIVGIEVSGAWAGLPPELLAGATRIDGRHVDARFAERIAWRMGVT